MGVNLLRLTQVAFQARQGQLALRVPQTLIFPGTDNRVRITSQLASMVTMAISARLALMA